MTDLSLVATVLSEHASKSKTYSICTIVSNRAQYEEMRRSFIDRGFTSDDTEYLVVDNTNSNTCDAYTAYNLFLAHAKNNYLILCHQDIVLLDDGRQRLDEIIDELNILDPNWGLFGNAGRTEDNIL